MSPIDPAEHARTIAELRSPKRSERPVIAIVARDETTEITDFLSAYGVLARSGIADLTVVCEHDRPIRLDALTLAPVRLHAVSLWVGAQATFQAFDSTHPGAADYVVVPALEPHADPVIVAWLRAQREKGAKIVSVCNGALTLAAAGLLDDHRATAHWSGIPLLQRKHPRVRLIRDRRYVADDGLMTTTGITATVPAMLALVEAIAGPAKALEVARGLGVDGWDERHRSADFQLTKEHRWTFLRNLLQIWRHESVGIPVVAGVDEIALALTIDVYARTGLAKVVTLGDPDAGSLSRHGLRLRPEAALQAATMATLLPPPGERAPAGTIDDELAHVAKRYDLPTAELAALMLEYPWPAGEQAGKARHDGRAA